MGSPLLEPPLGFQNAKDLEDISISGRNGLEWLQRACDSCMWYVGDILSHCLVC